MGSKPLRNVVQMLTAVELRAGEGKGVGDGGQSGNEKEPVPVICSGKHFIEDFVRVQSSYEGLHTPMLMYTRKLT